VEVPGCVENVALLADDLQILLSQVAGIVGYLGVSVHNIGDHAKPKQI
jgi:hypothetical protein